jgi:G3E family GTPase
VPRAVVDIVTGFLGSGKTTLLRHFLAQPTTRRIALVVNEFGGVDIDGRVLRGLASVENAIELENGCICCTIDEYRLARGLDELVRSAAPDLLIVETSGAADPRALVDRLHGIGFGVDAIVAVVDAEHVEASLARSSVARAQIEAADFLVLNKLDLVSVRAAERGAALLARLNPRALVHRAVRGAVDSDLLFATGVARLRSRADRAAFARPGAGPPLSESGSRPGAAHLSADRIAARVFRTPARFSRAALAATLERLPAGIYRVKGVVQTTDSEWALLVNFTCGRIELDWIELALEGSQVVVIGQDIDASWRKIEAMFSACLASAPASAHAREA